MGRHTPPPRPAQHPPTWIIWALGCGAAGTGVAALIMIGSDLGHQLSVPTPPSHSSVPAKPTPAVPAKISPPPGPVDIPSIGAIPESLGGMPSSPHPQSVSVTPSPVEEVSNAC